MCDCRFHRFKCYKKLKTEIGREAFVDVRVQADVTAKRQLAAAALARTAITAFSSVKHQLLIKCWL